jgi:hypothetical protein
LIFNKKDSQSAGWLSFKHVFTPPGEQQKKSVEFTCTCKDGSENSVQFHGARKIDTQLLIQKTFYYGY